MRGVLAGLLCAGLLAGCATTGREQLARVVDHKLATSGLDVDVSELSNGQLSAIYMIRTSKASISAKQAETRSVLGGRNSLRGVFLD